MAAYISRDLARHRRGRSAAGCCRSPYTGSRVVDPRIRDFDRDQLTETMPGQVRVGEVLRVALNDAPDAARSATISRTSVRAC